MHILFSFLSYLFNVTDSIVNYLVSTSTRLPGCKLWGGLADVNYGIVQCELHHSLKMDELDTINGVSTEMLGNTQ